MVALKVPAMTPVQLNEAYVPDICFPDILAVSLKGQASGSLGVRVAETEVPLILPET